MNFWWQPILRAVRLRGTVQEAPSSESEADLAERPAKARAGVRPGEWVRWWLLPERVEFWQGSTDRRHARIVYTRDGDRWAHEIVGGRSDTEEQHD